MDPKQAYQTAKALLHSLGLEGQRDPQKHARWLLHKHGQRAEEFLALIATRE